MAVKADSTPGINAYSLVNVAGVGGVRLAPDVKKQLLLVPIGHWMEEAKGSASVKRKNTSY